MIDEIEEVVEVKREIPTSENQRKCRDGFREKMPLAGSFYWFVKNFFGTLETVSGEFDEEFTCWREVWYWSCSMCLQGLAVQEVRVEEEKKKGLFRTRVTKMEKYYWVVYGKEYLRAALPCVGVGAAC